MRNTSSYVVARRAADRKESKRNRRYSGGGGRQDASLGWVEKVRGGCEVEQRNGVGGGGEEGHREYDGGWERRRGVGEC